MSNYFFLSRFFNPYNPEISAYPRVGVYLCSSIFSRVCTFFSLSHLLLSPASISPHSPTSSSSYTPHCLSVVCPSWYLPLCWTPLHSVKMRKQIRFIFFAHHKHLIIVEGARIAAPVHTLCISISPQWKQVG